MEKRTARWVETGLQRLLEADFFGIVLADGAGSILEANDAFLRMVGLDRDDFVSGRCRWDELTPPEYAVLDEQAIDDLRKGLTSSPLAKEYVHRDGHRVPVLVGGILLDPEEDLILALAIDLSSQRQTEEQLRRRTEELEATFRALPDLYFRHAADCTYIDYRVGNKARLYRPPEEFLGRKPSAVFPAPLGGQIEAAIAQVVRTGEPVSLEYELTVSGRPRCWEARLLPLPGKEVASFIRDITRRKQDEEALRLSEECFRTLAAFAPIGIFRLDAAARCTYVNQAWQQITGFSEEQGLDMGWLSSIHPDDRATIHASWQELRDNPSSSRRETRLLRPDGRVVWVEVRVAPVFGQDGAVTGWVGLLHDITERREREEERARLLAREQAALAEVERSSRAKDRFLAVLSHELRNPLTPILAGIEILRRFVPETPQVLRTLDIIERNTRLQARLVNDLLDLSRIVRGKIQLQRLPRALGEVVASAVQTVRESAVEAGLSLHQEGGPDAWVLGDYDRLQQMVVNLLSNAIKFTPPPGEVRVLLQRVPGSREQDSPLRVRVVVEDTGIGISPELLPTLFQIFQQGEVGGRRSTGLGIGLALVRTIAELHGGKVWAESAGVGQGSRFTVELPTIPRPAVDRGQLRPKRLERPVHVLLVEDNPDTRFLISSHLAAMGYRVSAAASGEEALELLATRDGGPPEVALLDIGLPGMNGYELLRRLRALAGLERLPAFAVTGYGHDADVQRAVAAGFNGHFVKPADVVALDLHIRQHLAQAVG